MITASEARELAEGKAELERISNEIRRLAKLGLKLMTMPHIGYDSQLTLVDNGFEIETVYDCGHISGYVISWE